MSKCWMGMSCIPKELNHTSCLCTLVVSRIANNGENNAGTYDAFKAPQTEKAREFD